MVHTSSPSPPPPQALLRFLRQEMGLSENALALGLRQAAQERAPLAVVLWRYGLLSLEQLEQVLQWQDSNG